MTITPFTYYASYSGTNQVTLYKYLSKYIKKY